MAKGKMYTITEAAKRLGVTRQNIHAAIAKKTLKAEKKETVQTVTAWLIPESALDTYQKLYSRKRPRRKK